MFGSQKKYFKIFFFCLYYLDYFLCYVFFVHGVYTHMNLVSLFHLFIFLLCLIWKMVCLQKLVIQQRRLLGPYLSCCSISSLFLSGLIKVIVQMSTCMEAECLLRFLQQCFCATKANRR